MIRLHKLAHETFFLTQSLIGSINDRIFVSTNRHVFLMGLMLWFLFLNAALELGLHFVNNQASCPLYCIVVKAVKIKMLTTLHYYHSVFYSYMHEKFISVSIVELSAAIPSPPQLCLLLPHTNQLPCSQGRLPLESRAVIPVCRWLSQTRGISYEFVVKLVNLLMVVWLAWRLYRVFKNIVSQDMWIWYTDLGDLIYRVYKTLLSEDMWMEFYTGCSKNVKSRHVTMVYWLLTWKLQGV